MGVPRFVSGWVKKIPVQYQVMQTGLPSSVPMGSLALDMNGIFHWAKGMAYGYGAGDTLENRAKLRLLSKEEKAQLRLDLTMVKIEEILDQVRPQGVFLMAVDGVAPLAKLAQQRQRRFRSALDPNDALLEAGVDPNDITPGTAFMFALDAHIKAWLDTNAHRLPPRVIYSNHMEPGEGEHKILALMRQPALFKTLAEAGPAVVYGLDADLFALMLVSPLTAHGVPVYLMREDVEDVASILELVRYLFDRIHQRTWGGLDVIHSFVVAMFLVGNDFLPHGPMFHDMRFMIERLLDFMSEARFPLVQKGKLVLPALSDLVRKVAGEESRQLYRAYEEQNGGYGRHPITHPDPLLVEAFARGKANPVVHGFPNRAAFGAYETLWLVKATGAVPTSPHFTDQVRALCKSYVLGLTWTLGYYLQGTFAVSPTWQFASYYAPSMTALATFLKEVPHASLYGDMNALHRIVAPTEFSVFKQLTSVLPRSSARLLPAPLRPLLQDADSVIFDLVPEQIQIDRDGTSKEYQGVALVPMVDFGRVTDAVAGVLARHPDLARDDMYKMSTPVVILQRGEAARPPKARGKGPRGGK